MKMQQNKKLHKTKSTQKIPKHNLHDSVYISEKEWEEVHTCLIPPLLHKSLTINLTSFPIINNKLLKLIKLYIFNFN